MNDSDGTDSQCCETTAELYGVAMGVLLGKEYCNKNMSKSEICEDSDPDSRISSERQAADGASDVIGDVSSSTNVFRLADTTVDNPPDDDKSEDTRLRIENKAIEKHLTSTESSCSLPEHTLDCSTVCSSDCAQHPDSFCPCDTCKLCKFKRAMMDDELKREIRWHRLWMELRDHIRSVFEAALEATVVPNSVRYQCDPCRLNQLRENVVQMCKRNSQELLLMLIVQAQEFVVELKNRIKETLQDHNLTNVAEIFLTRILDGYDAFVSTARQVTDLVKPVEERHLLKFNLTWEFFNKALYENHIWMSDPSMRNVTGSFTTQLTKSRKRHSYQALFERYVAFVAEMMRVAELWPETERLVVKWNEKQSAGRGRAPDSTSDPSNVSSSTDVVPRLQDKCEGSDENEIAERTSRISNNVPRPLTNGTSVHSSVETNCRDNTFSLPPNERAARSISRKDSDPNEEEKGLLTVKASTESTSNALRELDIALRHKTDIVQEIASDLSESLDREPQKQMCRCIYEHMREINETGRTWWSDAPCLCVLNLRWLCGVSKACPCLAATSTMKAIPIERPESPTSTTPTTMVAKQMRHSTTQTVNPIIPAPVREVETTTPGPLTVTATTTSTTSAPVAPTTVAHNHTHNASHQGPTHTHFHGSSADSTKSTGSSHRAHSHNNHASHTCHKQTKVEHIKRVLCNDLSPGDGDCSDSGSSQEDSCSTSSSIPRDSSRHCDCCYCEVFGPGLPSVAPVSRNFNEMRERLRQLLTKKKAKKCKAPCSPAKSLTELSTATTTSTDLKIIPPSRTAPSRSNTPIPVVSTAQPEQRDHRDLEALLEFIEGNQGTKKDNKKTEKKARQKQRKLDELLKKEKEEADKQKLIELQKKTPEVTITIVDPLKPIPQRLPQRNLPEVSILPATAAPPPTLNSQKQSINSKKKDKQIQKQQQRQKQDKAPERVNATSNEKNKTAAVSAKPMNLNVYDFVVGDNPLEKTKRGSKADHGKNVKNAISTIQPVQPTSQPSSNDSTDVKLTKKERKKLRREMRKLEEAKEREEEQKKVPSIADNKPQIVTIKRVMESSNAEPTVTITLKGQTPAEDKVLFTLVNGQTKEPGSAKSEHNQGQTASGKKKKGKGNGANNQNNGNQVQQQGGKSQQQVQTPKHQNTPKGSEAKISKQQQAMHGKSNSKKAEEKKTLSESQQSIGETKSTKSKKDKKVAESKQAQPMSNAKSKNSQQHSQPTSGKKQNKASTAEQSQGSRKSQQNENSAADSGKKKSKVQQQQEQNIQASTSKSKKKAEAATNKQSVNSENSKNRTQSNQPIGKQQNDDTLNYENERHSSLLSSQFKNLGSASRINIENLKLPPGITITKVDAPAKTLPIKSAAMPKPVTAAKQTTIIAAPMSGVQSSYPGPQTGGNVIVVDTGKLKQDLLPKGGDKSKEIQKESQAGSNATSGKKKKKKKGKNSASSGSVTNNVTNGSNRGGNDSGKENGDEPAKIVHNPGSNMITIRNPAFGPVPKIDTTPQAAIIKVSENGMVTIRSPALQQAINAGLTPPTQPDFIVKGDPSLSIKSSSIASNRATLTPTNATNHKNTNGIISPSLADFRSRLASDCTSLPGLANIHISKVTNGQQIPERGINLRGTSVTLTKVRTPDLPMSASVLSSKANISNGMDDVQQAKTAVREAISATMNVPSVSKGKKKKKRGNGTKNCGDDWNLVESVFTPKDIDLEDGEMDDAERELEAFKRFCLQSVPPPRKEKVNLNIKDIVLKKKSSSSSSSGAGAAIAAN